MSVFKTAFPQLIIETKSPKRTLISEKCSLLPSSGRIKGEYVESSNDTTVRCIQLALREYLNNFVKMLAKVLFFLFISAASAWTREFAGHRQQRKEQSRLARIRNSRSMMPFDFSKYELTVNRRVPRHFRRFIAKKN